MEQVGGVEVILVEVEQADFVRGGLVWLGALLADAAHESLCHNGAHGGGHEEGLHAHIDESCDGARRVVGVQGAEHQVTGEGGVDGDVGGFKVADFTDHDDVRRLTEHGSQSVGERHLDDRVHLDLVDAAQLVFHGVLHRDDLAVRLVDRVQEGVQTGRLAGTGRACDEEDAVRHGDDAVDLLLVVGVEAELRDVELDAGLVEDTHDDGFAVGGGDGGHTEIEPDAGNFDLDASVLRHALLGDVHLGHDLDAADDVRLKVFRRAFHFAERAVDAVADAEFLLHRLQMNI